MPESCKNRCTKAHEYLFLLAKGKGYYYDNEAVKEKSRNEWNSAKGFALAEGTKNRAMVDEDPDLFRTRGVNSYHSERSW